MSRSLNRILRGSNLISSDSYTNIIFRLKYLLAGHLKIRSIFILPLRYSHSAEFKNGEYGGRNVNLPKSAFFYRHCRTRLELWYAALSTITAILPKRRYSLPGI